MRHSSLRPRSSCVGGLHEGLLAAEYRDALGTQKIRMCRSRRGSDPDPAETAVGDVHA
jgi:hypothetical protein